MSSDEGCEEEEAPTHSRSDERKANDLVRLALAFEYQKKPLKREDIFAKLYAFEKETGVHMPRGRIEYILDLANVKLKRVFGMELVAWPKTVSRPADTRTAQGRKKALETKQQGEQLEGVYCLRSLLPEESRRALCLHRSPKELALLSMIIAIMNLHGSAMPSDQLESILTRIGAHEAFPDLEGLLETWKRQRYLMVYKKRATAEAEPVEMWALAGRGKVEFPPVSLAAMSCEMARITEEGSRLDVHIKKAFNKEVQDSDEGEE